MARRCSKRFATVTINLRDPLSLDARGTVGNETGRRCRGRIGGTLASQSRKVDRVARAVSPRCKRRYAGGASPAELILLGQAPHVRRILRAARHAVRATSVGTVAGDSVLGHHLVGAIANEFGLTNGARAVGRANGANPIPIVIPCHRVIGADGTLTGFGGGLPLKQALLELEGAISAPKSDLRLF